MRVFVVFVKEEYRLLMKRVEVVLILVAAALLGKDYSTAM